MPRTVNLPRPTPVLVLKWSLVAFAIALEVLTVVAVVLVLVNQ